MVSGDINKEDIIPDDSNIVNLDSCMNIYLIDSFLFYIVLLGYITLSASVPILLRFPTSCAHSPTLYSSTLHLLLLSSSAFTCVLNYNLL